MIIDFPPTPDVRNYHFPLRDVGQSAKVHRWINLVGANNVFIRRKAYDTVRADCQHFDEDLNAIGYVQQSNSVGISNKALRDLVVGTRAVANQVSVDGIGRTVPFAPPFTTEHCAAEHEYDQRSHGKKWCSSFGLTLVKNSATQ